jgi:hypothetical protein
MRTSQSIASGPSVPSAEQIADMLAVVIWADLHLAEEIKGFASSHERPVVRAVSRLESLLVSVRPVADARAELSRMDGELLLAGFEVWAARQRAVMLKLAASTPESL